MLTRINIEEFDLVYSIMENSFPEDEHRSYTEQKKLFERNEYTIFGYRRDDVLVGFLAVWEMENLSYIEHLAVREEYRNSGVGGEILYQYLNSVEALVVLEVELPENDLAKRRIGFYERYGFKYNEFDYVQLALGEGKKPVPLRIMSWPEAVTDEQYHKAVKALYKVVFGKDYFKERAKL